MTRREQEQLDQLVRAHGYAGLVAELSAHAMREVHALEQEDLDPRRYAAAIGEYAWTAEILGHCADRLASLEGD
jgi:hypothetical protein